MTKLYVICPGDSVTGGPELLHQLVHSVNELGGFASIVYYPFDIQFEVPDAYKHYNVKSLQINEVDKTSNSVVVPEVVTGLTKYFNGMRTFIWWLSVDNYFKHKEVGVKGLVKSMLRIGNQLPLSKLKNFEHLVQSAYAKEFLQENGIGSLMLSDYLNKEHFIKEYDPSLKRDIVCYNPKKGYDVTRKIIENNPDISFVPIQNMTSDQVAELLSESKIYIDFGNHPGKDRIPREAAMAGCIVITGIKGSARNSVDIPVDRKYKVDESSEYLIANVSNLIRDSFNNYDFFSKDFDVYRDKIVREEHDFNEEVRKFYQLLVKN
ncbi:hypothetical protein P0F26_002971 [Vibrio metschnikovii]|nr:hypothetical protein [Vibrio metschnikovii]